MPEGLPFICRPLSSPIDGGVRPSSPPPVSLRLQFSPSPSSSVLRSVDFWLLPPFPLLVFTKSGRLFRKGKKGRPFSFPLLLLVFCPFCVCAASRRSPFHPEDGNSPIFRMGEGHADPSAITKWANPSPFFCGARISLRLVCHPPSLSLFPARLLLLRLPFCTCVFRRRLCGCNASTAADPKTHTTRKCNQELSPRVF